MSEPRLYDQDDIRRIFALATREQGPEPARQPGTDGLSLTDLVQIGREVGVDSEAIARAAAQLDRPAAEKPVRRSWGSPTEVSRTVPLPGPPTDEQWEMIVAELRSVFRARGRLVTHGGVREWVNGNLHACVEPTRSGYRLRLATRKGDAGVLNALGVVGLTTGAVAFGSLLLTGGIHEALFAPYMVSASGAAALLANALRLPRWSRERQEQMALIGTRVRLIMEGTPAPVSAGEETPTGSGSAVGRGGDPARIGRLPTAG